jgi:tRNA-uridine 2-sulfurtransferase
MAAAGTPVIVGLSGGVDSAVSAYLLREQGYAVEGLFMKNWDEDDNTEYCTARRDLADAEAVCRQLGIRLHTANFAAEYWDNVFEHFLAEYRAGRTPNPDVLCNREIKFKVFAEYASTLGAERIATGHYARLSRAEGRVRLLTGKDPAKDQSYFLHAVPGDQLGRCLFPVGELPKSEVRRIAREQGFGVAGKKDSTGICFIGERRFADFLKRYLPAMPGDIRSVDGQMLGKHHGLMYYTLGQRQGLGIGGVSGRAEEPWYVVDKQLGTNTLVVAQGAMHPALLSRGLRCSGLHWIDGPPGPGPVAARIRYRQSDQPCTLQTLAGDEGTVVFSQVQRAVTPGQYVVFYQGEHCLGGGVIEERVP